MARGADGWISVYEVNWRDHDALIDCPACGYRGSATTVLEFGTPQGPAEARRCPQCDSIALLDEILGSSPDDSTVDDYITSGAGIGVIAALVADLPEIPGGRMLDVGCGYGFALDFARWRHGWQVTGVEPSYAGARGRDDLGLDIRIEPLTASSDVGTGYDVILSSEVLEHVTDPLGLLTEMSRRLRDGGLLVLTTPDAAVIDPTGPESDVVSALSPGYHVFLPSRAALESLLEQAGFTRWAITRTRVSHEVVARKGDGPLPELRLDLSPAGLAEYLRERGEAVRNPVLRAGFLSRATRELVAAGRIDDARRAGPALRRAIKRAHGIDIGSRRHPVRWPDGLAGCAFALGMAELLGDDAAAAVRRFDEALSAVDRRRERFSILDLDTIDVEAQARFHRALALARVDPEAAPEAAASLDEVAGDGTRGRGRLATWTARIFVELAARGHVGPAARMLGSLDEALVVLEDDIDDAAVLARRDALICRPAVAGVEESEPAREADFSYYIDVYWADTESTYVSGWLHLDGEPGDELVIVHGASRIPVRRTVRADLQAFWPDAPAVTRSGFSVMLDGLVHGELTVEWNGAHRDAVGSISLPRERRPAVDSHPDDGEEVARLIDAAPPGPVLILGARRSTGEPAEDLRRAAGDREIVGLDIHPGLGVDIVADVHRLSSIITEPRYPVILSSSLLEHVAAPWLVALEISRTLPVGGLAVHIAPWVWPTHAHPNDFWRFSPEGLRELFSPMAGFEVIGSGSMHSALVIPTGSWRAASAMMPTTTSGSMSWVCAIKRTEPADDIAWPYDGEVGRARAEQYPIDGIVPAAGGER